MLVYLASIKRILLVVIQAWIEDLIYIVLHGCVDGIHKAFIIRMYNGSYISSTKRCIAWSIGNVKRA